ncbi:MAG: hypothetical protein VR67_11670 [Peptococcaceae bacterium BRH_c8a]|nr:MAG: hypothetical protein VR67_11670 [Peptococcaceae bacterium BRH_c8a]
MALTRFRTKTAPRHKKTNINESFYLWELLKSYFVTYESIKTWEDYAEDTQLNDFLKRYSGSLEDNITRLETAMDKQGLGEPDRQTIGVTYTLGANKLNDRYIANETLTLAQKNVDLLTRAIGAPAINDDIHSLLVKFVPGAMEYRDEMAKYVEMNGWLESSSYVPQVTVGTKRKPAKGPSSKSDVHGDSSASLVDRVKQDTLTIGTIAGLIGVSSMHIVGMLWMWLGWAKVSTLQVSGAIFIDESDVNTTLGLMISAIAHLIVGSAGGVLLSHYMKYVGKDFFWLKGLALSGLLLLGGMGLIVHMLNIYPKAEKDALTQFLHMINYFIYGIVVSYILARYAVYKKRT